MGGGDGGVEDMGGGDGGLKGKGGEGMGGDGSCVTDGRLGGKEGERRLSETGIGTALCRTLLCVIVTFANRSVRPFVMLTCASIRMLCISSDTSDV